MHPADCQSAFPRSNPPNGCFMVALRASLHRAGEALLRLHLRWPARTRQGSAVQDALLFGQLTPGGGQAVEVSRVGCVRHQAVESRHLPAYSVPLFALKWGNWLCNRWWGIEFCPPIFPNSFHSLGREAGITAEFGDTWSDRRWNGVHKAKVK